MKGIILETAVPIRQEPSDRAEMVNQLLFGEIYQVLEEQDKWVRIISTHDSYEGWLDRKQHTESLGYDEKSSVCTSEFTIKHSMKGGFRLTLGALIPSAEVLSKLGFETPNFKNIENETIKICALKFINAPYLWGGRTPSGIDCSGFTQLVYRMKGMNIPRDASEQVNEGNLISFLDEAKEGDLAFFDNAEGKIIHVGIILEENNTKKIIHASGRVRIDKIDHQGIYNDDLKGYSHQLRTIKTLI